MKQARILSKEEFKRVLAVIDANRYSERNRAIFHLSFLSGMRAIEIASLKIGDVVDDNYKVKSQIVLDATQTKGSESNRVMISSALQKELQKYVDAVIKGKPFNKSFIASQQGKSFSALTIVQLFKRFYIKAGITGASSHSGRRQFITELAENQINMRVIQALARHKHMNTTSRYIDINDTKLQNAVEAVKIF